MLTFCRIIFDYMEAPKDLEPVMNEVLGYSAALGVILGNSDMLR